MDDIYFLTDLDVAKRIGANLKSMRLRQNITQSNLAESAGVSLSTLKKIENGDICSFDSFLRMLRTLRKLDVLQPLVDEEQLSPNEYYKLVQSSKTNQRKRAAGKLNEKHLEESEW
jgi:DNA-binding XRE family transcriptional regulator